LGFGIRFEKHLVGCILCSPQTFRFTDRVDLMGSSSFYVDQDFRGHGGRVFLQYTRLGNRFPLFGTSANAQAAALWKAAGAHPIPGSEGELLGVIRWPAVAEEFAHRRSNSLIPRKLASGPIAKVASVFCSLRIDRCDGKDLRELNSANQGDDLAIHRPSQNLTAMRDTPYLQWRYFSGQDPTAAAFAFPVASLAQEVLVTVNQRDRGYRRQIKTLNLLDVYPEVTENDYLRIIGSLIERYRGTVDVLVLRHQNESQRQLLLQRGFRWRAFEAPTAWLLDRAKLLPTEKTYFVPADGDGLI
jgi:hypothetical protein